MRAFMLFVHTLLGKREKMAKTWHKKAFRYFMPVDRMYFMNPLDKTNKGGHIPVTAFGIIMTRRPRL